MRVTAPDLSRALLVLYLLVCSAHLGAADEAGTSSEVTTNSAAMDSQPSEGAATDETAATSSEVDSGEVVNEDEGVTGARTRTPRWTSRLFHRRMGTGPSW